MKLYEGVNFLFAAKKLCDRFETERLVIRSFSRADGSALQKYAVYKNRSGFEVWDAWPEDAEGCADVAQFFADSGHYWAVCRKADDRMIGFISYNEIDDEKHLDLGHGFIPTYTPADEAVEALRVMINYAFAQLDIAAVDARNEKSWTEQIAPLLTLQFAELSDRMQMPRESWESNLELNCTCY